MAGQGSQGHSGRAEGTGPQWQVRGSWGHGGGSGVTLASEEGLEGSYKNSAGSLVLPSPAHMFVRLLAWLNFLVLKHASVECSV